MSNKSKKIIVIVTAAVIALAAILGVVIYFSTKKPEKKKDPPPPASAVALTADMLNLEYTSIAYNRSAKTPTVEVKNGATVISSSEYTVVYQNNVEVGTATVTVSAKETSSVITGSASAEFTITKGQLSDIEEMTSVDYDGLSHIPVVYLPGLHVGTDYTISWMFKEIGADDSTYVELDRTENDFVEKGNYKVTAVGMGSFEGTKTAIFTIHTVLPEAPVLASKDYTGVAQLPTIEIADMTEGIDYEIAWEYKAPQASTFSTYTLNSDTSKNFVNAGDYKLILKGLGLYGGQKTSIYTINPISISNPSVSETQIYNGSSLAPNYGVTGLQETKDFTVSWEYRQFGGVFAQYTLSSNASENFINSGEYRLTVFGTGNYVGETNAVYSIQKATFNTTLTRRDYRFNYNDNLAVVNGNISGGAVSYKITNVEADKLNLSAASWTDYDPSSNINAGTYYVYSIIAETDNYAVCRSQVATFTVSKDILPGLPNFNNKIYDGTSKAQDISLRSKTGAILVEGVDYTISWFYQGSGSGYGPYVLDSNPSKNFIQPGMYQAFLYAIGNYTEGAETTPNVAEFTITKDTLPQYSIKRASYTIDQQPTEIVVTGIAPEGYDDFETYIAALGGTIEYYYNTVNNVSASGWTKFLETDHFDVGTYYIYARVVGVDTHNDINPITHWFQVLPQEEV